MTTNLCFLYGVYFNMNDFNHHFVDQKLYVKMADEISENIVAL